MEMDTELSCTPFTLLILHFVAQKNGMIAMVMNVSSVLLNTIEATQISQEMHTPKIYFVKMYLREESDSVGGFLRIRETQNSI